MFSYMLHLTQSFLDGAEIYLNGPIFMALLLGTGLFFTVYLGFPQLRYFKRSFRLLLGKEKSTSREGDTSILQAVATSLASSIGAGSFSGVAMAIHIGGPASVFWMWVNALLGMATRMAEAAVSHRYREKSREGTMVGGPMYYMSKRLGMHGLGVIFALGTVCATFLAGSMPQINGMTKMLYTQWGIHQIVTGGVISVLVGMVVIGGIQRIGQVAELLVPLMTFIYLGLVMFVVIGHYDQIIPALQSMFGHPFRTTPALGGFLGANMGRFMQKGVNYGFFTNDAGSGTAAIAHCASEESNSGRVALISMLEPFISTCLICTLTALAIVVTGSFHTKVLHDFERIDIEVVAGDYHQAGDDLHQHMTETKKLPSFTGDIMVENGVIGNKNLTILHDRSVAENIVIRKGGELFSGAIAVYEGRILALEGDIVIRGESLLKDADLGLYTFTDNPWGGLTGFLMILCFLLFAFSTVISYSYFGDRALVYLGVERYLFVYRFLFVFCAFLGGIMKATLVWKAAVLACAMMAIPNLIGILLMHKEVKKLVEEACVPVQRAT